MTRTLAGRLILSHLLVAVIAALTGFAVVRWMAPAIFDNAMGQGMGPGMGRANGMALRQTVADAVTTALVVGGLVSIVLATGIGVWLASRLVRSLSSVRDAVSRMADGDYAPITVAADTVEVGDLVRDVNTLGERLAGTEAQRMRLLGDLAHEMRTPLTVIDGYVEAMIDGVLPANGEQLGELRGETSRLRRLTEDLSALSRASEHRFELQRDAIDLDQVLAPIVTRLGNQAESAGVSLRASWGAGGPVDADADRIGQVVTNLVGNAIRATPDGGRIEVTTTPAERHGRAGVSITVSDTGEGIAPEDLTPIFERFYRARGRRPVEGDHGSGIGLTIAREIMHAHGGELTAASPGLGHGATFTAWLPRALLRTR